MRCRQGVGRYRMPPMRSWSSWPSLARLRLSREGCSLFDVCSSCCGLVGGRESGGRSSARSSSLCYPRVLLVAVAFWAHRLTHAERNGSDALYSVAVLGWALLAASCLFAWVVAAVKTAAELRLGARMVKAEALVSCVVVTTMVMMAASTVVWWVAVARSAPWYFAGTAPGTSGTVMPLNLLFAGAFMLLGVTLGLSGTLQALRASSARR